MNSGRFISKDRSTLEAYYKACAREAAARKDKMEQEKYQKLLEEIERGKK